MRRLALIVLLAGAGALAACTPVGGGNQVNVTFEFTGGAQTFTVPAGVHSINVTAVGAAGGNGFGHANSDTDFPRDDSGPGGTGGLGGVAVATISVTPGETLEVHVGGRGADGDVTVTDTPGGFNGGGTGGVDSPCSSPIAEAAGGGGGGASDVRRGGTDLEDRVVVAGGGGGGGSPYVYADTEDIAGTAQIMDGGNGGSGGGSAGQAGGGSQPGGGGTQSAGGSQGGLHVVGKGGLGVGGEGDAVEGACDVDTSAATRTGGGGGGGLYGGGGGAAPFVSSPPEFQDTGGSGGGGGSGFGPAGTQFFTGVNEGNGRVVISYNQP